MRLAETMGKIAMMAILADTTMVILMEAMMDDNESPRSRILGQHCMERNHTALFIVDQIYTKVEPKIRIIGRT